MPFVYNKVYPNRKPGDFWFRLGDPSPRYRSDESSLALRSEPSQFSLDEALQLAGLETGETYARITFYQVTRNSRVSYTALTHIGDLHKCFEVCSGSIKERNRVRSHLWSSMRIEDARVWTVPDREHKYRGSPTDAVLAEHAMTKSFFKDPIISGARKVKFEDWYHRRYGRKTDVMTLGTTLNPVLWLSTGTDNGKDLETLQWGMPGDEPEARKLIVATLFTIARTILKSEEKITEKIAEESLELEEKR